MNSGLVVLVFIAILLLFIKKEYIEVLINLIIGLIIDFTIVKGFSTTPLFGAIAISVGKPLLIILMYAISKIIILGIYYLLLQRNSIIAILGYILMSILFNIFIMSISGSIFIDIIFNAIISGIIYALQYKFSYLDELKWFTIISMITSSILEVSISLIFFK